MASPLLTRLTTSRDSAPTSSNSLNLGLSHIAIEGRADRKLSQVTKKLAVPRDIRGTKWGGIRTTCRDKMGIEFDGWQDGMGSLMLSVGGSGKLVHTVGGFHLSAMRQIGKTYFGAGGLFGMCVEWDGLLCIWTAHHTKTSNETFGSMIEFAQRRQIAPFIKNVYTGSGDEAIEFINGSRILFGARERGFGRGIPGVDVLVSDEGQILSQKAMSNMIATLNTSWLGLHMYFGTPPLPEELSKAESWMRARGLAWVDGPDGPVLVDTEDFVWIEIGAADGLDRDDPLAWAANPSWPHRTPTESIMRLRRMLKDDGFDREGLGLYEETDESKFDLDRWNTLKVEGAPPPSRAALVIDVSPDSRWSCVAIVGDLRQESAIDARRDLAIVKSIQGTAGVVKYVEDLRDERDIVDIAITGGAARGLETQLTRASFDYHVITLSESAAAYASLLEAVKNGTIAHVDQGELSFALENMKSRYLQTGEAQTVDRREYSVDLTPAVGVANALYRWGVNEEPMPFLG